MALRSRLRLQRAERYMLMQTWRSLRPEEPRAELKNLTTRPMRCLTPTQQMPAWKTSESQRWSRGPDMMTLGMRTRQPMSSLGFLLESAMTATETTSLERERCGGR